MSLDRWPLILAGAAVVTLIAAVYLCLVWAEISADARSIEEGEQHKETR